MFAGYLLLFSWLITRIGFFKNSGLSPAQLVLLFLMKVMAGIFYGWIGAYYGQMAQMIDTWGYHVESLDEYELLKRDPALFFKSFLSTNYDEGYSNFFSTDKSWWNDIKGTFLVKLMAIFNLFSFGKYYVNVIFICFITFFGPVALFRVMMKEFPGRKTQVLLATFLLPSFLYWTSGLHKEGLIFTGLAFMVYGFYSGFSEKRFPVGRILLILFGFLLVLILRNFLVITLLPPLIAWILCYKARVRPWIIYTSVLAIFILAFFNLRYLHPSLDFPQASATKQEEFRKLGGGSAVDVRPLEPDFKGFLYNTPQSIALSLLRPYPGDVKHLLSLAASLEINFILLLFVLFLIWPTRKQPWTPYLWFCFVFSLGILMMIGYTVNVLGAIVRYRSIVLPFLVVPVVAMTSWKRIFELLSGNSVNKNNI